MSFPLLSDSYSINIRLIEVLHELGAVRMFLESWQLTNQGFGPLLYLSHEVQLTW
jgi:hypothetical protein